MANKIEYLDFEKRISNLESLFFWIMILVGSLYIIISKKYADNVYIIFLLLAIVLISYPIVAFRFIYLGGVIGENYGLFMGNIVIKYFNQIKFYGFYFLIIIGLLFAKYFMNLTWIYLFGLLLFEIIVILISHKIKK